MNPLLMLVLSNVLNFVILLFLLGKFLVPRLAGMMDSKQQAINASLDEADKNLADVQAELEDVKREMAKTEQQIAEIRAESQARGASAAEKLKADTEIEIEQLRQRVERQIEQEFNNLRVRLRQDLIAQVMVKAEELIREKSDIKLHTELVENFAYSLKDFKEFKS